MDELLARRRDRAIAIILSFKERECDRHLPPEVSAKLRKIILDQLNDFHDLCADALSSDERVVWNELFLQKIDEMHDVLVNGSR